ncbi:MAG: hypothetical protein NT105_16490 [Verrucomicrobia bacterium]|nr:hypothetical protein [Verrucomicrobiota bacterium]
MANKSAAPTSAPRAPTGKASTLLDDAVFAAYGGSLMFPATNFWRGC